MSGRWYKRCGADFIHGTMMLTLEEKGAYSLCLDLIYDRGGPIPDDARWLSGVCGVSVRKWNAIRGRLIELGKLSANDGLISNFRAAFELVSAEKTARERAESGARGGRTRAENATSTNKNNDIAQAELKQPFKQIREDKRREEEEDEAAPHLRAAPLPYVAAKDIWNENARLAGWPLAETLSDTRRRSLGARLRDNGLDGWNAAVIRARSSPYLGHDPPSWFTFNWIIKPENFLKLIEGNYDRQRSDNTKPSGWGAAYASNVGGGLA
jgi:uncharacterized protein YdaU (DUF1376 family)